ncbi:MAG: hypothetical protein K2P81_11960 [Bacteriovoracaceae bacterium]|nr:hypothetical protein [Bacteriovoracaceae bacterium]
MKMIIAAIIALSAFSALARPGDRVNVRPRLWNFGNQVQVEIWNTTQVDIECRGTISISGQRSMQSEYYWETIYRGMSQTRTYWLRDFQDRVIFSNEFINCYER